VPVVCGDEPLGRSASPIAIPAQLIPSRNVDIGGLSIADRRGDIQSNMACKDNSSESDRGVILSSAGQIGSR